MLKRFKLKKEGISNIEKLDVMNVNCIAKVIAEKLSNTFKVYGLEMNDIFISIARLNMYLADFEEDYISAKYSYASNTIYFSRATDLQNPDSSIIHECIHYIQTVLDSKGSLERMGLFKNINFFKSENLALNEAAVQYVASNSIGEKPSTVKYFDLELVSPSSDFYPIETALIRQMMFFTGSYPLFYSTLLSNDIFKDTFINITSEETFNYISKEFDNLLKLQDKLGIYNAKRSNALSATGTIERIAKKIDEIKNDIQNTALNIQDVIFQNCFNNLLNNISTLQDAENVKIQLSNFENFLIHKQGDLSFYEYKIFALSLISDKENYINVNGNIALNELVESENALMPIENKGFTFIKAMFSKLKLFFEVKFKLRMPSNSDW